MNGGELRVGLIGGTGDEGRGLGLRWAQAGATVTIGSRSIERAGQAADWVKRASGMDNVRGATNGKAIAESCIVMLTVPFEHAAYTLESHVGDFHSESVLIDITVPVSFEQGRVRYVELPEGSASEHLKSRLPDSVPLVAAFKTEPAHLLMDPTMSLDCDIFVASDSREAKGRVIEAISLIPGVRAVDAGALYSARSLERMTVLAIGINRRYKIKSARYRVVGLPSV